MEFIVLDFETYWDSEYTLKKLSTSEYLRDPRFETLCMTVLRQSEGFKPRFIRKPEIAGYLDALPWQGSCLVAHHLHFDGAITAWHYGHVPARYFCTMSASQFWNQGATRHGLDPLADFYGLARKTDALKLTKGKRYADLTDQDWQVLEPYTVSDGKKCLYYLIKLWDRLPTEERDALDLTIRMFTEPKLEVDLALAREALSDAAARKAERIGAVEVTEKALRSADQFAQMLRDLGVDPPLKPSPRKPDTLIYAFAKKDEAFLELLEHPDTRVRTLVEAKIEASSNIDLTRAQRIIKAGETGPLPVYLKFAAAGPHRWAGGNKMNLQNLRRGSKLRRSIRAPKGFVIGVADAKQIEPRMNAWHAGQEDLLDLFRRNGDPYNDMASAIYGREIDRKRKLRDSSGDVVLGPAGHSIYPEFLEGFVGKTAFLGLGYRMWWIKFQASLATSDPPVKLPDEECLRIVNIYRAKNNMIAASWPLADEWLRFMCVGEGRLETKLVTLDAREKRVWFPNGTSMYYPGLHVDENGDISYFKYGVRKWLHGGVFIENIVQKACRDKIRDVKLDLRKEGISVVGSAHDEVIALFPEREADEWMSLTLSRMRAAPWWAPSLPLDAEGSYDYSYSK